MKTKTGKNKAAVRLARDWRLYAMLAVPFFWYILFCYKPMSGIIIAFQKYSIFKGIAGSKFVGLDNFKFVFGMRDFGIALGNTLLLNFLDLLFGFPMPIILAIMLNEMRTPKLKKVSQTMLYLPHFLSWVIIGGMVLKIFAPTTDRRGEQAAADLACDASWHPEHHRGAADHEHRPDDEHQF